MITIIDNKEPLVDITSICQGLKINLEASRLKHEKSLYLRYTVAKMLREAQIMLPKGLTFCINDAYRPFTIQQKYFRQYYYKFQREYPNYTHKELHQLTAQYVIDPDDIKKAGHLTGAAVDLVLCKNGKSLPMKNLSLSFEKRSMTSIDQKNDYINNNRVLLNSVMTQVGFVNYANEYWHYSYGDYMWAESTNNKTAIYGQI